MLNVSIFRNVEVCLFVYFFSWSVFSGMNSCLAIHVLIYIYIYLTHCLYLSHWFVISDHLSLNGQFQHKGKSSCTIFRTFHSCAVVSLYFFFFLFFFCGDFFFSVALRPQRPSGLLGPGSPGRLPRLSHSS